MSSAPSNLADRRLLLLIWAVGFLCAGLLIAGESNTVPDNALVFNEMLVRLLHGQFDISAATIGDEAIVHHGRTYAYFGIFCALLRLPLLLSGQIGIDVTKVSILVAAAVSLAARLAALDLAMTRSEGVSRPLRVIVLAAVAVGGESLQFLRPAIYQEVCCWGEALATVFVWLAVRRVMGACCRPAHLYVAMAVTAGLALLCRVSFGLGLYTALTLMLAVEAWRGRARLPGLRAFAPALLILVLFAGVAAGVNAARWDDPFTFVPFRSQLALVRHGTDRLQRVERYGEVNLERAPFALQYYFAPVWMLQDRKGALLFQKTQFRLFDVVELPPSSLLLSDPLICLLAGFGIWAMAFRRARIADAGLAGSALLGLACPLAVILAAISLCFRYRMDFYPALDFAACLGAAALRIDPARQPRWLFLALGAVGGAVAVVSQSVYYYTPLGSALDLDMRGGWMTPIVEMAHGRDPYIGHLLPDGRRIKIPLGRPKT
jgi:hypothetical protein